MTLRRLIATLLFGFACLTALAVDRAGHVDLEQRLTPEELASVGLSPAQLARLNVLLRDADARDAAQAAGDAGTRPAAAASAGARQFIGLDVAPISAKVRGRVQGWAPGTVFDLDSGEQWTVLKGTVKLARPVDAPTVRLIPGIAGRWFLELDEDHPKARVYRAD